MMHKPWYSIEQVLYCFLRSFMKFQGNTGRKIDDLNPNFSKITRPVVAIKSLRFALLLCNTVNLIFIFRNDVNLLNSCESFTHIFGLVRHMIVAVPVKQLWGIWPLFSRGARRCATHPAWGALLRCWEVHFCFYGWTWICKSCGAARCSWGGRRCSWGTLEVHFGCTGGAVEFQCTPSSVFPV